MPTVLVIDDDPNVRDILRRTLGRAGYGVLEAAEGEEGLRCVREEAVDLVVTDLLMPGQEGIETILHLRTEYPDLEIIVVSGGGSLGRADDLLATAVALGAKRSFEKPIPRAELLAAVEELVGPGNPG